jgi:hypothetical protein
MPLNGPVAIHGLPLPSTGLPMPAPKRAMVLRMSVEAIHALQATLESSGGKAGASPMQIQFGTSGVSRTSLATKQSLTMLPP